MNKLKENKAITLIALVITIIVLLILAGVAISAISGNQNTMGKAQESREKSKAADELDSIKLAVVNAKVQGSYDLNVDQQSLKEGLEGIVDNPEEVLTNADSWTVTGSATKKLYTITKQGEVELVKGVVFSTKKVEIAPGNTKEITVTNVTGENITWTSSDTTGKVTVAAKSGNNNIGVVTVDGEAVIGTEVTITATAGTESDTCKVKVVEDKVGAINALIGKTVNYTAPTASGYKGAWQVFYADETNGEVFIITEKIIETNTQIGGTNDTSEKAPYSDGAASSVFGTASDPKYGRKYNSKWFTDVANMPETAKTNGNPNNNAKTVAYLCDTSSTGHWSKYAGGTFGTGATTVSGTYAVGGPTVELLAKSLKEKGVQDIESSLTPTATGYNNPFSTLAEPYKAKYNDKSYGFWWLASPSSSSNRYVRGVFSDGIVDGNSYNNVDTSYGVRPLVSIPLSSFNIDDWVNE